MSAEQSPASVLCLACGLCCSGNVYSYLPLDPDEVDRTAASGFSIRLSDDEGGAPVAPLPCAHLRGTACAIHDGWRPRACGAYMCRLQQRMAAGEVSLEQALEQVGRIKALIARLPDPVQTGLREEVSRLARVADSGAVAAEEAQHVLLVGLVNREIDRVIRYPHQATLVLREAQLSPR